MDNENRIDAGADEQKNDNAALTGELNNPKAMHGRKKIEMPKTLKTAPAPYIRSTETTTTIMLDVLIALIPAFLWGVYVFGVRAAAIMAVSVAASVGFEAAVQMLLHRPVTIGDLSAAVTGLLIAMNLPVTVPLWMPIIGAFFAIVVVKQLFGGIGCNFVNPALSARVFLLSWSSEMSNYSEAGAKISSVAPILSEADITVGATPLASLRAGDLPPETLFDMLLGRHAGCIGEVSAILLIAGGIYLLVRRVITWHIPVAYIGTVAILTFLFPQYNGVPSEFMLYELLSGSLILGAFFMATDYSTSPITPVGRLIFGVGCGALTVLMRYFGAYPEGVPFAILVMNLLVWYIDKITMPARFGGKSNVK